MIIKRGDLVPTSLFKAWAGDKQIPVRAGADLNAERNWATGSVIVRPVNELSGDDCCLQIEGGWDRLRMEPKVEINGRPEGMAIKTPTEGE